MSRFVNDPKRFTLQRTFEHMFDHTPRGNRHQRRSDRLQRAPAYVPPKDRIKYWNFARGDLVVVAKGNKDVQFTPARIHSVLRGHNRVMLSGPTFNFKKRIPQTRLPDDLKNQVERFQYTLKPYEPANLRLMLNIDGENHIATRVKRGKAQFDPFKKRITWERSGFFPSLLAQSGVSPNEDGWRTIPWPEEIPEPKLPPGPKDASLAESTATTFLPSFTTLSTLASSSRPLVPPHTRSLESGLPQPRGLDVELEKGIKGLTIDEELAVLSVPERELNGGVFGRANRRKWKTERRAQLGLDR